MMIAQKWKKKGAASKGRQKVVEEDDEEVEFKENDEESKEEKLVNFEESKGEEGEGYASLDYKEDDYVELEEED